MSVAIAPRAPTNHLGYPVCPACGTEMLMVPDRLGRIVDRCPTPGCAGHTFRPTTEGYRLPPIAPGQLRCQVCAAGVTGRARLCTACRAVARRVPLLPARVRAGASVPQCDRCERPIVFAGHGRPPKRHDVCRTPAERTQRGYEVAYTERQRAARALGHS